MMLKNFRRYLIPHEENDHQPHLLRTAFVTKFLLAILLVESFYLVHAYVIFPRSDFFAAVLSSVLVEQTNAERAKGSLATLKTNPRLEEAARLKAEDMAARGYFAHNTPDGKTPWWFIEKAGYYYDAAGENLAVNFSESADVTAAWMHSPLHRANIENARFTEIGIATAQGMHKGKEAIFVVQMFGRPASPLVSSVLTVAPPTATTTEFDVPERQARLTPRTLGTTTLSNPKNSPASIPTAPTVTKETSGKGGATTSLPQETDVAGASEDIEPIAANDVLATESAIPEGTVTNAPSRQEEAPSPASIKSSAALNNIIASPRRSSTALFVLLGMMIALPLFFVLLRRERATHPYLYVNGLFAITIIAGFLVFNYLLSSSIGVVY